MTPLAVMARLVRAIQARGGISAIPPLGSRDRAGWTQRDIGRMDGGKMADLMRLARRQAAPNKPLAGEDE